MAMSKNLGDREYQKFLDVGGYPTVRTQGAAGTIAVLPNLLKCSTGTFVDTTTGKAGTHELFTVTGIVAVTIFGVCDADVTTDGAATFEVGTASSTAGLLPQITATNWDASEVWEMTDANLNKLIADSLLVKKIVTESSIGLKITTANATGGSVTFYLSWYPLSDGATVTAATYA